MSDKRADEGISSRSGTAPPVAHRWRPGQSGNPNGRRDGGLVIVEWANLMIGWTASDIRKKLNDEEAPAAQRIAARLVLAAMSLDLSKSGVPTAGSELDRLWDRLIGKPQQSIHVTREDATPEFIAAKTMDLEKMKMIAALLNGGTLPNLAGQQLLPALPPPPTTESEKVSNG